MLTSTPNPLPQEALQFSHMGFHVKNMSLMASFYKEVLSFTQTDSGQLGTVQLVFLSRNPSEHHQVVLIDGRAEDAHLSVINQISFRVPDLATLRLFHQRAQNHPAVSELLCATHGNAISIYFRDPEKNRIEIFMDTPWYCEQPLRESIDLGQSDEQVMAHAQRVAMSYPRFQSREQWIHSMKERMGYTS